MLTAAALVVPALRTLWWWFPEGPKFTMGGFYCPLGAEPHVLDHEWLDALTVVTLSAELDGVPAAVMALCLSAILAFRGRWSAVAGWVTAALFVLIAGVFTIPYAVQIVSDGCARVLRFGGWDIVTSGVLQHYLAGAALVVLLTGVRRAVVPAAHRATPM
ncbi:hypothetical protein [Spongiactinospora sp. 9N601]|uniref:hypothetical protein n=1 Tax=Spongiactinospora sp. 9N601 TaxID=3375149 RepID=UPI0037A898E7